MAAMVRTGARIDRRLVQLASNPTRAKVLELLAGRTANLGEISAQLGIDVAAAREHVKALQELGLIELADQRLEDGRLEQFYRAIALPNWSEEELAELSLEERLRLAAWIVEVIGSDAAEALDAGTFNARTDTHLSRTRAVVDEQGWRELARLQDDALNATFAVHAASAERLAESGEEGIYVMGAMLSVEMPAPRRPA